MVSPELLKSSAIFISFASLMYFKSRLTPLYADDYPYSFIWDGENNGNLAYGNQKYRRVRNFKDLLKSQISHYKTWDGRTLAESLVQIFLAFDDKKHFDRANTLVILTQLLLCAAIGSGNIADLKSIKPEKALLLTAGFFLSAPHLIATCFWLTGSMNYLWMGILQSAFVLPYSLKYHGSLDKLPKSLAFLSGLLSGWSTETGAGASMMLAALETIYSIKHKEYASWMGYGILGCFLGILLLLISPGNGKKIRLWKEEANEIMQSLEDSLPGYVPNKDLYTSTMFKKWFMEGFLPTVIRELPLQIPVIMYFLQGKKRDRKTDLFILALESAVFAIPSVMMLSPQYPRRSTYSSVLFLLSAASRALDHLNMPDFSTWNPAQKLIAAAVTLGLSVNALSSLIVDADNSLQFDRQIRFIKENKNEPLIYVEDTDVPSPYAFLAGDRSITDDICMGVCVNDENDYYNKAAAAYYGVQKIKCGPYEGHVYEQNDPSSILFSIVNPLKSLAIKTGEIIFGKKSFDALDTVYYPLKKCGRPGMEYYVYEKPLKDGGKPVVYSLGGDGSSPETKLRHLKAIMKKLRHDHIDLMKLKIRGSVFETVRALKESAVPIGQICLEVKERYFYKNTKMITRLVRMMHRMGYIVIYWDRRRSRFTFLKRDISRED